MLKVTLSDYSVIYAKTIGEALEKAFKLGQNIRFIDQESKMKKRKYTYWRVLQQNGGYSWDDVEHFDVHNSTLKERKQTALEYIKNMPNYSYRWVDRRELNK